MITHIWFPDVSVTSESQNPQGPLALPLVVKSRRANIPKVRNGPRSMVGLQQRLGSLP